MQTGKMFMRFTWASVRNDEGNVIGGITGGAIEVEIDGKCYSIEGRDLWNAVCLSVGKPQYIFENNQNAPT